jgi:hypothetical protein
MNILFLNLHFRKFDDDLVNLELIISDPIYLRNPSEALVKKLKLLPLQQILRRLGHKHSDPKGGEGQNHEQ